MTEPMVEMDDAIVQLAYDRCNEVGIAFWSFVETKPYLSTYYSKNMNFMMPPEAAHKVRLLAGPHWRTILKMVEVKDG